jgi:hypothetical protein
MVRMSAPHIGGGNWIMVRGPLSTVVSILDGDTNRATERPAAKSAY